MIGRHLVKQTEDSQDASFVQVECLCFFVCAISDHLFSSMLYMLIDTLTAGEKHLNSRRKISLGNFTVFSF